MTQKIVLEITITQMYEDKLILRLLMDGIRPKLADLLESGHVEDWHYHFE